MIISYISMKPNKIAKELNISCDLVKYEVKNFIDYRNKIIIRQRARKKAFRDTKESYYDIRLKELNELFPQYKNFGIITLK